MKHVFIVTREGEDYYEILKVFETQEDADNYAGTLVKDCWGSVYVNQHAVRHGTGRGENDEDTE